MPLMSCAVEKILSGVMPPSAMARMRPIAPRISITAMGFSSSSFDWA